MEKDQGVVVHENLILPLDELMASDVPRGDIRP
jgi:hypothetical protein